MVEGHYPSYSNFEKRKKIKQVFKRLKFDVRFLKSIFLDEFQKSFILFYYFREIIQLLFQLKKSIYIYNEKYFH